MKTLYIILSILILASCKSKKTIIDKKETETENVIVEEKKTEEKKQSETETEKKEEKSVIDEWLKIESDKIIITDKDGTVTKLINPRISKEKSESKEIIIDNKKVTETEENMQRERKETAKKETKSDISEERISKPKNQFWLWVFSITFFGGIIFVILKWFRLI